MTASSKQSAATHPKLVNFGQAPESEQSIQTQGQSISETDNGLAYLVSMSLSAR